MRGVIRSSRSEVKVGELLATAATPDADCLYVASTRAQARQFWSDALMPVLKLTNAVCIHHEMRAVFPNNSKIRVGYAEGDYRGLRLSSVVIDQAANVSDEEFAIMVRR